MRYTIEVKMYKGNDRIIRGLDLSGMFGAKFIAPESDYDLRFRDGGWVVSEAEYPNFCEYYASLLGSVNHPKSLFELAAWIVNSRKHDIQDVPKHLIPQLNKLASQY
jgi:hypothetical protein